MPTVLIPLVFQGPTRGESRVEVPSGSIEECIEAVDAQFPGLKAFVIDPATGLIHKFVKVTLNDELLDREKATLVQPVGEGDVIEVIAAIAGG